jgi:hypothetical protein
MPVPEISGTYFPAPDTVAYPSEPPIPLHAPTPNPPCIRMLTCPERRISGNYSCSSRSASVNSSTATPYPPSLPSLPALVAPTDINPNPQDYYSNGPLVTFPTPSELLNNLAVHDGLAAAATAADATTTVTQPETSAPAPGSVTARSRRSRGRIIAQNIGFRPTDPWVIRFISPKCHISTGHGMQQ